LASEVGRLGVAKEGGLDVYLADKDAWHVRIGSESLGTFCQRGPLGDPVHARRSIEQATKDFLADTKEKATAFVAKAEKATPAGTPLTAGQKIKFQVDAVLDELIFRLEPREN